jgi:hypothetical protein
MTSAIAALVFVLFVTMLTVGASTTLARVVYYERHGFDRPALLVRDALVFGGLAVSFLLIALARFVDALGFDSSGRVDSSSWLLVTSLPALVAVAVYLYYELVVIDRRNGT